MKTKTINLYSYQELSDEAKKKALAQWIEGNDYYFLQDNMNEWLHELLEENKIKDTNDTSKAGTKPTQVFYSLGYAQGDGAMFEGTFEWGTWTVNIKQSGHYTHSNSKTVSITRDTDNEEASEKLYQKFEAIYQKICKELERRGYDFIEYEDSEEAFIEACEANDYTFRANGVMENI